MRVEGLGFRMEGTRVLGFGEVDHLAGPRTMHSGFRAQGAMLGLGFRVSGLGFRVGKLALILTALNRDDSAPFYSPNSGL